MEYDLIAKAHQALDVWQGKLDKCGEFYAADVLYHMPPFPDIKGLEGVRQMLGAFNMGFPDFQSTSEEDVIVGNTTIVRWICTGTFTGQTPLMPIPPTGKKATAPVCIFAHWKDGVMSEVWHYGDWLGWLTQFGVIPPMG
jgi:predicted ester cyclase